MNSHRVHNMYVRQHALSVCTSFNFRSLLCARLEGCYCCKSLGYVDGFQTGFEFRSRGLERGAGEGVGRGLGGAGGRVGEGLGKSWGRVGDGLGFFNFKTLLAKDHQGSLEKWTQRTS